MLKRGVSMPNGGGGGRRKHLVSKLMPSQSKCRRLKKVAFGVLYNFLTVCIYFQIVLGLNHNIVIVTVENPVGLQ